MTAAAEIFKDRCFRATGPVLIAEQKYPNFHFSRLRIGRSTAEIAIKNVEASGSAVNIYLPPTYSIDFYNTTIDE